MSADFDLESALFLLNFRRLSAEQQRLVEWMIHNIGTLDKLLSAGDTPVGALSALRDGALERGDDLLALRTRSFRGSWTAPRKKTVGDPANWDLHSLEKCGNILITVWVRLRPFYADHAPWGLKGTMLSWLLSS